jgi:uncharacterized protein YndB with AHSA1/START domain
MTERSVKHATFTLERTYPVSPARVFAAWADPATKARWFAGASAEHHELDFRAGGTEVNSGRGPGDVLLTFETRYHEIVPDERIVFASTLREGADVATVSVTTVELAPVADGTRLQLTQYSAFLDGHEEPRWRVQGTSDQLTALGKELTNE